MKKNKKNIAGSDERIFIQESDLEALLKSERWMPKTESGVVARNAASAEVGALVEVPTIDLHNIDVELLTRITSSDIIDRFLSTETHRIVAEEGEVESEIVTEAELQDEDDMVSEELAEVYLAQGLKDMAIETYRKLSLLNPEKSIYFAELISKIEN